MRNTFRLAIALIALVFPALVEASPADDAKVASPTSGNAAHRRMAVYVSSNRAMLMLRVGKHPPFPVVFDTGVSANLLIDTKLADQLGLPDIGPMDAFDAQGVRIPGHKTRVSGASVSGVALPEVIADASSYDLPDEVGIISPNSFSGKLLRIELSKGTITLLERDDANMPRCASSPYSHEFSQSSEPGDTLPSAVVNIGKTQIAAEIDTGNTSGLILPTSYISRLPLEGKPISAGYGQSQVGREEVLSARIDADVVIAGVTLEHPDVLFMAAHKPNIGLQILKAFTIVLDPAGQRDWLIPAGSDAGGCEAPASPASPGRAKR